MKKLILFAWSIVFVACLSDDSVPNINDNDLVGKWKLIAQYLDPGDGSGDFQPVSNDRVFQFFSNEIVTVNGLMCNISNQIEDESTGTYEITSNFAVDAQYEGIIYPDNCNFPETRINFNITSENYLVLWYPCIEGCAQKFEKID